MVFYRTIDDSRGGNKNLHETTVQPQGECGCTRGYGVCHQHPGKFWEFANRYAANRPAKNPKSGWKSIAIHKLDGSIENYKLSGGQWVKQ